MSNSPKLIIFCAPSGSGKTTIVRHLLQKYADKLAFSVSATTRSKRPNEVDGKDYYFLTVKDFEHKIAQGAFAEYEQVYAGSYYGTLLEELEKFWQQGKIVLFDVDVKGGVNLKKKYGKEALSVFVKVSDLKTLENRLRARNTETEESLKKRLEKAAFELTFESQFDLTLINNQLETSLVEAEKIIAQFCK